MGVDVVWCNTTHPYQTNDGQTVGQLTEQTGSSCVDNVRATHTRPYRPRCWPLYRPASTLAPTAYLIRVWAVITTTDTLAN